MREVTLAELPGLAGQEIGVSDWLDMPQDRVNRFADATGDHQWIHVDVERATKEMGGPIAHGYLLISLLPMLSKNIITYKDLGRGINYGLNKVRFTNMAPVGGRIRLRLAIKSAVQRAGAIQLINECTIEGENEERPICVAETVALLYPAS